MRERIPTAGDEEGVKMLLDFTALENDISDVLDLSSRDNSVRSTSLSREMKAVCWLETEIASAK